MKFKILKQSTSSSLRTGVISTSHGKISTPVFMPVGTVGAVKSVAPWELRELGAEIILGNTYHLYLRPGEKLIKEFAPKGPLFGGGLTKFNQWNGPILTDSGGYQVFSLSERKNNFQFPISNFQTNSKSQSTNFKQKKSLVKITDDGVEFRSHLDGSKHFFSPEKVVDIQLALGSDIIMPLDVCPPSKASRAEIKKAVELSIAWLERSAIHLDRKFQGTRNNDQTNFKLQIPNTKQKPALFGIIQGGIYPNLRKYCAQEMIKLNLPGYAIGGLAVGESQKETLKIVSLMDKTLPKDKPRYLMGVGTPDDLIKATRLGMDMFDCVLPTRMARHGVAFAKIKDKRLKIKNIEGELFEEINLLKSKYREDKDPIDKNCQCPACKNQFSLAYISHLIREKEILGIRLLTLHNLWTYFELMRKIRTFDKL